MYACSHDCPSVPRRRTSRRAILAGSGVGESAGGTPARAATAADSTDVRKKYGIEGDYLFYPAQFWAHKNHVNLLYALRRLRDQKGFDAFKWRVGAECGRDIDEWPGRTEAIVPQVARALGDDVAKLVDANSGFSPRRAVEVGRWLEAEGISHYEEPCPYWKLAETKLVTDALDLDVAGGEQDWDLATWERMIGMHAVDIVQPDVMYMGGISRTLQVVNMAAAAGMPCTPHSANLSLVTLCTMHLLGAIPNAGKYLELSIEGSDYYPWQVGLFSEDPYAVKDGRVTIPSAPGWGVEINPAWLRSAAYRCSRHGG